MGSRKGNELKALLATLTVLAALGVQGDAAAAPPMVYFVGKYKIVWDGWQGSLWLSGRIVARSNGYRYKGYLIGRDGKRHLVRYAAGYRSGDTIFGRTGPGHRVDNNIRHRVVFWVDFNDTPRIAKDDQRFDGYLMTQTKNAIAGITWWRERPFGFYAVKR